MITFAWLLLFLNCMYVGLGCFNLPLDIERFSVSPTNYGSVYPFAMGMRQYAINSITTLCVPDSAVANSSAQPGCNPCLFHMAYNLRVRGIFENRLAYTLQIGMPHRRNVHVPRLGKTKFHLAQAKWNRGGVANRRHSSRFPSSGETDQFEPANQHSETAADRGSAIRYNTDGKPTTP